MTHRFAELAFTRAVRAIQESMGSRKAYAKGRRPPSSHRLGDAERDFIATRDSFYLATVSETGWPYIQHRGGPPGFVRVLDRRHWACISAATGNISRGAKMPVMIAWLCSSWTIRGRRA